MQFDKNEVNRQELTQAESLFRRRQFATVVRNLAPQIFLYRGNRRYFFLLGVSSLYIGDFSGAHSYLLRARDLDPLNMDIQLGLAISHLGRKESTEALRLWVGIQDKHPTCQKAKQALEMLKSAPDKVDWTDQLRLGRLRSLYPEPGFDWHGVLRWAGLILGGVAVFLALLGLVFGIKAVIDRRTPPPRPGLEQLAAQPNQPVISAVPGGNQDTEFGVRPGEEPRFLLADSEIKATVAEIRSLFREYRDNKARILLNKLMQSNASETIKFQMRGLSSHFKEPGFTNFRDNYEYVAVHADPRLHAGAYVMWRGRIAGLEKTETAMRFSFLLGYESSKIITGTIPVRMGFAANINNGDSIELIGQVQSRLDSTGFQLAAVTIRMIKGLE